MARAFAASSDSPLAFADAENEVFRWRLEQFRQLGLSGVQATELACVRGRPRPSALPARKWLCPGARPPDPALTHLRWRQAAESARPAHNDLPAAWVASRSRYAASPFYCPECAERSSSATDAQEVRRALNLCTRSAARVKALTEWGGRYCGADRPRWSGLGAEPLRLADNPRRRLPERGSRPDQRSGNGPLRGKTREFDGLDAWALRLADVPAREPPSPRLDSAQGNRIVLR